MLLRVTPPRYDRLKERTPKQNGIRSCVVASRLTLPSTRPAPTWFFGLAGFAVSAGGFQTFARLEERLWEHQHPTKTWSSRQEALFPNHGRGTY
jgi:hypothetical protein